jgi:hypothetical protein
VRKHDDQSRRTPARARLLDFVYAPPEKRRVSPRRIGTMQIGMT